MAVQTTYGYLVAGLITLTINLVVASIIAYIRHHGDTGDHPVWSATWRTFLALMIIEATIALILAWTGQTRFIDYFFFGQYLMPLMRSALELSVKLMR